MNKIGLGLAAIGRPAYMTPGREVDLGADRSVGAMRRRCHELLDVAYDAGMRYVDAARSYGLAEQFLSAWWDERQLPDSALVVGSKWGYTYTGGWRRDAAIHEVKDHSIATLRRHAAESCRILGPRLSIYQIHSATVSSGVLDDREVLAELARLRASGIGIGLSVTGPHQAEAIRRAIEVRIDGVRLFQSVQATWNLLEPSAGCALADARAAGCFVIVKEVLANGRLTARYGGPALAEISARAAELDAAVESVVFAATLRQPWLHVALSGAVTCAQLQAHLAAFDLAERVGPLPPIAEPAEAYWRRRRALAWN